MNFWFDNDSIVGYHYGASSSPFPLSVREKIRRNHATTSQSRRKTVFPPAPCRAFLLSSTIARANLPAELHHRRLLLAWRSAGPRSILPDIDFELARLPDTLVCRRAVRRSKEEWIRREENLRRHNFSQEIQKSRGKCDRGLSRKDYIIYNILFIIFIVYYFFL